MLREQIAHATFAVLADEPLGLTGTQLREAVKASRPPMEHIADLDEWEAHFDRAFYSTSVSSPKSWLARQSRRHIDGH